MFITKEELSNLKRAGVKHLTPYTHPNPLARWIFFKRLEVIGELVEGCKGKVLDFGCGSGLLLLKLSKLCKNIYGLDIDIDSARTTCKIMKCHARLKKADGNRTGYK
ncbi:MAG: hypothetical protein DRH24_12705, partial [Deltaproteobacteria bacterium]